MLFLKENCSLRKGERRIWVLFLLDLERCWPLAYIPF